MALVEIAETVTANRLAINGLTTAVTGAEVRVYERNSVTPVTVYTAGGVPIAQPLLTVDGEINGWVQEGSYDLNVTYRGETRTYTLEALSAATALASGGARLGLAKMESNFSTSSATAVDVTGLTVTVVHTSRPAVVEFGGWTWRYTGGANPVNATVTFEIYDVTAGLSLQLGGKTAAINVFEPVPLLRGFPASTPGQSKTYKVRASVSGSTTLTLFGAATGPAWLEVTER